MREGGRVRLRCAEAGAWFAVYPKRDGWQLAQLHGDHVHDVFHVHPVRAKLTLLATHEGREAKARNTKTAAKATATAHEDEVLEQVGDLVIEQQPQNQVLHMELSHARKTILQEFDSDRALRSVMVDLNNIAAGIAKDQDPEKVIAKEGATQLRGLLNDQSACLASQ